MNDERKKKLKAAILGAIYYMMEAEEEQKPKVNRWSRFSRLQIMHNHMQVQMRSNRNFSIKRF